MPGSPIGQRQLGPFAVFRGAGRKAGAGGVSTGGALRTTGAMTDFVTPRLIGEGRDFRPRRWALPITAFLVMPICLPIADAL